MGKSKRRGVVAALIAGVVLGSTGVAGAATAWKHDMNGIHCESYQGSVLCVRSDGEGYGIGFDKDFLFVTNANNKTVFKRYQPSGY